MEEVPKPLVDILSFAGGIAEVLQSMGMDCSSGAECEDTPKRMLLALQEMTSGYKIDIPSLLKTFDNPQYNATSDDGSPLRLPVTVRGIHFVSLCEHHVMPFTGTVICGYFPNQRVIGLSKIARIVDAFARRFTLQERLAKQIAETLANPAFSDGSFCVIRSGHSCMSCRGVRKVGAQMVSAAACGRLAESFAESLLQRMVFSEHD